MKAKKKYDCTACLEEINIGTDYFALEGRNDNKRFCSNECLSFYYYQTGKCFQCKKVNNLNSQHFCKKCKLFLLDNPLKEKNNGNDSLNRNFFIFWVSITVLVILFFFLTKLIIWRKRKKQ